MQVLIIGKNRRLPVDFDNILQCIASRHLLVIAPEHDRNHSFTTVNSIVEKIMKQTTAEVGAGWLSFLHPDTYDNFPESMQQPVADWLGAQTGKQLHQYSWFQQG